MWAILLCDTVSTVPLWQSIISSTFVFIIYIVRSTHQNDTKLIFIHKLVKVAESQSNIAYRIFHVCRQRFVQSGVAYHVFSCVSLIKARISFLLDWSFCFRTINKIIPMRSPVYFKPKFLLKNEWVKICRLRNFRRGWDLSCNLILVGGHSILYLNTIFWFMYKFSSFYQLRIPVIMCYL